MKFLPRFVAMASVAVLILSHVPAVAQIHRKPSKTTAEHKDLKIVSYLTGVDLGTHLKRSRIELDLNRFVNGLKTTFKGGDLKITENVRKRILAGKDKTRSQLFGDVVFDVFADGLGRVLVDRFSGFSRGTLRSSSDDKPISYLMGGIMGKNLKRTKIELDLNRFVDGLSSAFKGETLKYSEKDRRRILGTLNMDRQFIARRKALMDAYDIRSVDEWDDFAAKNQRDGEKFLASNAKKKGVTTTRSGLQYQIIAKGRGSTPDRTDKVHAIYKGTLLDGTVFVDSEMQGVRVGDEIAGLSEALQMMPVGAKWKLFIPTELAYSEMGPKPPIEPNATLILAVEVLDIAYQASPENDPTIDLVPAIAVTFPKRRGDKVTMIPVDTETGVSDSK